jgi:hypothetical protein
LAADWSEKFLRWWRAPVTRRDRLAGALIAAFGGFWVGVLLLGAVGGFSSASAVSAWWALGGVAPGALFGWFFPKLATLVLFPFASFGGGA